MAKRCRAAELRSLLGVGGLFLNSTRKPPSCGPVFHITPLSGNAGRSPPLPFRGVLPFDVSVVQESSGFREGVLIYSCATVFCFFG